MAATNNFAAMTDPNNHAFWSNKKNLTGETLLKVAETMSNRQITDNINSNIGTNERGITIRGMQHRIDRWLAIRATQNGDSFANVKAAHDQIRFANGAKSEAYNALGVRLSQAMARRKAEADEVDVAAVALSRMSAEAFRESEEMEAAETLLALYRGERL